MNAAIVFVIVCIASVIAGPVYKTDTVHETDPQLVNYQSDNIGVGHYNFMYEISDGQKRDEHAQTVLINDEPSQVVYGSYSYVGTDGVTYSVNYTADKNGYHPSGTHIPQSTY